MGLDSVELVLRCEEESSIALQDRRVTQVRTVGEFYVVICEQLAVPPLPDPDTSDGTSQLATGILKLRPAAPVWTPANIWSTLVAIILDQLQVRPEEVRAAARIQEDLGCD